MKEMNEVLQTLFNSFLSIESQNNLAVLRSWIHIVGIYGEYCEPIDIKNGNLILAVGHPGWHVKFKLKEEEFLQRIQKTHPQLKIKKFVYVFDKDKYEQFKAKNQEILKDSEKIEYKMQDQLTKPASEKSGDKPEFMSIIERIKHNLL